MVEFGKPRIILPRDTYKTSEAVTVDITAHSRKGVFVIALGNLLETGADAIVYRALASFGPSSFGKIYSALKVNAGAGVFYEAQNKAHELRKVDGVDLGKGYKELPPGYVIETGAGSLPKWYKYILHVNLVLDGSNSREQDVEAVSLSVANCLHKAGSLELESVAFPAIGMISEIELEDCLLGFLRGTRAFYDQTSANTVLNKILFVRNSYPSGENALKYNELVEQQLRRL